MDIEQFRTESLAYYAKVECLQSDLRSRMQFFSPITNHFTNITGFTPPSLLWCEKYDKDAAFMISGTDDAEFPLVLEDGEFAKDDQKVAVKWLASDFLDAREVETAIRNEFFEYVRDNSAALMEEINSFISTLEETLEGIVDKNTHKYYQFHVLKARQRTLSISLLDGSVDAIEWEKRVAAMVN